MVIIYSLKIRIKLLIIFCIISVSAVTIISVANYIVIRDEITKDILERLDAIATIEKSRISNSIQRNYDMLSVNSARPNAITSLDNYNKYGDKAELEKVTSPITSAKNSLSEFKRISILNTNGTIVTSTDKDRIGINSADEEFFIKASAGLRYQDFFLDHDGNLEVILAAPLYLDNNLVGVMSVVTEPESIFVNDKFIGLGSTGEFYLAKKDENGDTLFITPTRFDPNAALQKTILKTVTPMIAHEAVSAHEGLLVNMSDYRGVPVLAATRYIEEMNWGLVVKMDQDEAYKPLDNIRNYSILGIFLTLAITILASIFLARTISNPIIKIQKETRRITEGNLKEKIQIKGDDEIADLAKSFNVMTESLTKSINRLAAAELDRLRLEEFNKTDKLKKEFSAMVTHELKTPLVPILGYCKMLKTSMLGTLSHEQTNAIDTIEKNAKRLEELIRDIMNVRKLDMDEMKFLFENLSLDEFFDNLDSSYKKILKERQIEFATKLSAKNIVIHTDKVRLRQVLDNLISNSTKFVSEKDGLIEVGGYQEKDSLILYVKDNGIGIPKDKQNDLFKKFYQIDTSMTRPVGGTGLGLAISKGIMEKLGGAIWVESDGKTGTIFYMKLPLVEYTEYSNAL